jgi:hypothetical protein
MAEGCSLYTLDKGGATGQPIPLPLAFLFSKPAVASVALFLTW